MESLDLDSLLEDLDVAIDSYPSVGRVGGGEEVEEALTPVLGLGDPGVYVALVVEPVHTWQ